MLCVLVLTHASLLNSRRYGFDGAFFSDREEKSQFCNLLAVFTREAKNAVVARQPVIISRAIQSVVSSTGGTRLLPGRAQ